VTPDSLFITWQDPSPTGALLDHIGHYDRHTYAQAVKAQGLDQVVAEDWADLCAQPDGFMRTPGAAQERTGALSGRHVVEITRETLRAALIEWLELAALQGEGEGMEWSEAHEVADVLIEKVIKGRAVLAVSTKGETLTIRYVDGAIEEHQVSGATSHVADALLDLLSEL